MDLKKFSELIMIEQTLFALPFAYIGILFAGGAPLQVWIWATFALFGARSAGMAFNRLLDSDIDKKNPRTANRILPAGKVTRLSVWVMAFLSSALLVFSSWMLNSLVFYLSFAALFLLYTYSFFKRFSATSHFYLGIVEAAAPVGGYLAVTGSWMWLSLLPGAAILFWIAGIDILYSIQDMEFDRSAGLHSVPARFGIKKARVISLVSYLCAVICLVAAGWTGDFGIAYFGGILGVSLILSRQQVIAFRARGGLVESMKQVFFLNRFVSPMIFFGAFIDWIMKLW